MREMKSNMMVMECGSSSANSSSSNMSYKGSLRLFGADILVEKETDEAMNKNSTTENLGMNSSNVGSELLGCSPSQGYPYGGLVHPRATGKKGTPWTKEEHHKFLVRLKKLGRGHWKGIASNYVTTRTSTQVASHAQKYFKRLEASLKKKPRPSIFDTPLLLLDEPSTVQTVRNETTT